MVNVIRENRISTKAIAVLMIAVMACTGLAVYGNADKAEAAYNKNHKYIKIYKTGKKGKVLRQVGVTVKKPKRYRCVLVRIYVNGKLKKEFKHPYSKSRQLYSTVRSGDRVTCNIYKYTYGGLFTKKCYSNTRNIY